MTEEQFSNTNRYTELLNATVKNDVTEVSKILLSGIDPNVCPSDKTWNAVHSAIEHEAWEVLAVLLQHGGNIDSQDRDGSTLLHHLIDLEADSAHQAGIKLEQTNVDKLLKMGADPLTTNFEGQTPLQLAKEWEHTPAIRILSHLD